MWRKYKGEWLIKYAGIIYNDFASAPGVCLTFFTQGCPHKCKGCHNPETWDFNGGKEFNEETLFNLLCGLIANNIHRDFCIQGGEPLCPENLSLIDGLITAVKLVDSKIKVYIWTGYIYEELKTKYNDNTHMQNILQSADYLIDGPYQQEQRDITLLMRGSSNQRIIDLKAEKDVTNGFEWRR